MQGVIIQTVNKKIVTRIMGCGSSSEVASPATNKPQEKKKEEMTKPEKKEAAVVE